MYPRYLAVALVLLLMTTSGCSQAESTRALTGGVSPSVPQAAPYRGARAGRADPALLGQGKIQHIVIIFQENRSVDNLFHGFPGADTVGSGLNSAGEHIKLQPVSLSAPYDIDHEHRAFEDEYDGGLLDGFAQEVSTCTVVTECPREDLRAYAYVPLKESQPYFTMAGQYAFADRMFQSNSGPSFPAHQYILSGTSTIEPSSDLRAAEEPVTPKAKFTGGCDSPKGSLVRLIDGNGAENLLAYPCFDRPALTDLLDAKSLTWRYYQMHPGAGQWNGPDAIKHIRESSEYATDVVSPPSQVLSDVANGRLANMVWVTPTAKASDHAGVTDGSGPSWVASVVNAIGKSSYWDSTAIFVTWDDWGGWYDHVKPPQYNSFELGFRVPLIAISPYAKKAYISRKPHEFGSILKFTEKAFGLGSLGTTDIRADDLSDCFNFAQQPRTFSPIPAKYSAQYFLRQPVLTEDLDDD